MLLRDVPQIKSAFRKSRFESILYYLSWTGTWLNLNVFILEKLILIQHSIRNGQIGGLSNKPQFSDKNRILAFLCNQGQLWFPRIAILLSFFPSLMGGLSFHPTFSKFKNPLDSKHLLFRLFVELCFRIYNGISDCFFVFGQKGRSIFLTR